MKHFLCIYLLNRQKKKYETYDMANFSPISRPEIPARLLKQKHLKSNKGLHGELFSPCRTLARVEKFLPGLKNWVRKNGLKNRKKSHVIKTEFQPRQKRELGHAFSAHNFIFGTEGNISAWAKLRHVIGAKFQPA